MSDIRLDTAMNTNTHVRSDHVDASATGSSDGALHAHEGGASYAGSTSADTTYGVTAPELPDVPDASAAADTMATADATVNDATAHADAALGAAGDLGAPQLPALDGALEGSASGAADASVEGASASFDAILHGWLDVMGDVMAQLSGSLTALVGF